VGDAGGASVGPGAASSRPIVTVVAGVIAPPMIAPLGAGAQQVVCGAESMGHGPGSRFNINIGVLLHSGVVVTVER
jgi:tetrahydromethanopterin S-methyltransferase subunit A